LGVEGGGEGVGRILVWQIKGVGGKECISQGEVNLPVFLFFSKR